MAATTCYSTLVIAAVLMILVSSLISNAQTPPAFTFPIKKDTSSNQYYTTIQFGSNSTTVNVVIDLGGKFLFFNSPAYFSSASSFRPIPCDTPQCTIASGTGCIMCISTPPVPNCTNNTCADTSLNPFTGTVGYSGLGVDVLHVTSTKGAGYRVARFPFQYSDPALSIGLSNSTTGALGLGRTKISLPAQLVSAFKIRHKFTICLPSSSSSHSSGNMIIGSASYDGSRPFREISKSLIATRLIKNPVATWGTESIGNFTAEYFIQVKSIRVGSKKVSLNTTLLSIDKATGGGGTSIRTVRPYTGLHSSILKALIEQFVKAAAAENIRRVASVAPFGAWFDSKTVANSTTGEPQVHRKSVVWRFYGWNSMVRVSDDVICLAFVDVGVNLSGPSTAIVVGGHQMENHLLEFDVASSKLSFSPSLLKLGTSCSEFRAS